ncbi:transcription termination factor Rho [Paramicrobacterium chengjingii]|uniref:Transcription termination factor Rho n=1 Tax=Paramicrobacterium chengjingii TaxID=2769067 RepID=A0ABX6YFS4_9MICO|nr:transcription termination factor Rho [Microbacterium chengjingii]QPZ37247.1 transcription termination factor Rho [Microbacterium chengjingii]
MTDAGTRADGADRGTNIQTLKVAELQKLAVSLGVQGASKLRKGELVAAITEKQGGGSNTASRPADTQAAAASQEKQPAKRASRRVSTPIIEPATPNSADSDTATPTVPEGTTPEQAAESVLDEPRAGTQSRTRSSQRSASRSENTGGETASGTTPSDNAASDDAPATQDAADGVEQREKKNGKRGGRRRGRKGDDDNSDSNGQSGQSNGHNGQNGSKQAESDGRQSSNDDAKSDDTSDSDAQSGNTNDERGRGRNRNRNRNNRGDNQNDDRQQGRGDRNDGNRTDGKNDDQGGRGRGRYRDRKRGQNDDVEPEITEDDVLVPIAGILDVLDNYAFVRTTGYLSGASDVYVSLGQVKKYNLRKGDAIVGAVRQPREGEHNSRQKYNAIVKVDSVNGQSVDEAADRVQFGDLTPLYPQERLRMETEQGKFTQRLIDLIAPVGKGQRGLIVAPPKAGKTIVLQQVANAIAANNPEVHLMVVLVDERPEEVTDMQRTVKGEVIASTFDRPAEDHTTVAELAIERAKRLVELGHDVVVLLDSITRLGRAYNISAPTSGRVLSGGVDAAALYPPKRFFGAARNIENGGSLTILATALVETGSKMDEVIFEEFKGTGNSELRLSRQLADKRIFPAIDVNASSTRREEMLLAQDEVKVTWKLRRALAGLDTQQALEVVLGKLKETSSNVEFLVQMQKSMPQPATNGHERDHR